MERKNYVIRPIFIEKNVLHAFMNRKDEIMRGKEKSLMFKKFFKESNNPMDVIKGKATICFLTGDAKSIPIPDESIFLTPSYSCI